MREALAMFWTSFTSIFRATNRIANGVDHLARWGEVEARFQADSSEAARAADLAKLDEELEPYRTAAAKKAEE